MMSMKVKKTTTLILLFYLLLTVSGCHTSGRGLQIDPSSDSEISIPFPRLGMWWPNPWEQSLDDIARYNWVILFPDGEEFIDPIKSINPDILLLTATNACEIGFNPAEGAFGEENAWIQAIPPEWYLTQVGTVLSRDVNASSTVFHVENMSVTDGENAYQLFIPGDTVLIGSESVLVESIDEASRTLTVQRGYVRPASSHPAGIRIAAHITFWPNSWLMNVSTMAPAGEEQWVDYNARAAAELLSNPGWDGILLDRADANQSWLIDGSTARTIDPDQSNTLLNDYSDFDRSWNEGLRQYETKIRKIIGNKKIIFTNWGMDNFDLINGNNYEGFPLDDSSSYRSTWRQTVFGSIRDTGSYADWIEKGQKPNLTMIETYEDDGGPEPTSDGIYDNPNSHPFFEPNYRKMRFGLTTALLNDGYFSYEINTNGHGYLGLLWFDEYDNAGEGAGYLGLPLGPAYSVADFQLTGNLVSGGDFNTPGELEEWNFWTLEGNKAVFSLEKDRFVSRNQVARIDIEQTNGEDWQIALSFENIEVAAGKEYTLSFRAKADRERDLSFWAQENKEPWEDYLDFGRVELTTEWRQFEVTAQSSGTDNQAIFQFALGEKPGSLWLDDVVLQEGNTDVWRRDYQGGIVLVNATASSRTVELGDKFKKIKGHQVPEINTGEVVSRVELNPNDGIILLRK